jgi:GNAT superfamily N-acetyltransferase
MADIRIHTLSSASPEIAICARWRVEEFGDVLGTTVEDEERGLRALASDNRQAVLLAKCDGAAAGTCLLVTSEIDPLHVVSPWLAGLYVAPAFRRLGIGRALVQAIEEEACARRVSRLYLYAGDNEVSYYERLDWNVLDRIDWKGFPTNLMVRPLLRTH